ncbi:hypothetical protein FRC03_001758 [Tulasnella sp. 419]|nr:hypothetical protein FRC02_012498 [Tulasnella sp. 418]KAG8945271.1 hypothetical protein FRC03_001758 [Tulasnella sp. 419]
MIRYNLGSLTQLENLRSSSQRQSVPEEDAQARPQYAAYDRSCFLMRHIATSHMQSTWLQTTRFVVDVWHYIGHRADDVLCRTYCNPAPVDGSQPDLIVEEEDENGVKVKKRAFNTETAEQLNAWFAGYKGALNRMTDFNFDFFVYSVLFLHAEDWRWRRPGGEGGDGGESDDEMDIADEEDVQNEEDDDSSADDGMEIGGA